jgi:hypothetical protein
VVERNPVVDCSEVYHPIVAAGSREADPMADAADVVQVAERRIVGVLVGRRDGIDCEPQGCKRMTPASFGIGV